MRVKVANNHKNMDWAVYVYKKDGETIKIMYSAENHHTVLASREEIKSVKVFLRVNGEKKQVKEFLYRKSVAVISCALLFINFPSVK